MSTQKQRSFAHGELAPWFWGHDDIAPFHSGLRTQKNFYTMKGGGSENRGGFKWVGSLLTPSQPGRLIPFKFSNQQQYVVEFTNQVARVIYRKKYLYDVSPDVLAYGVNLNLTIGDSWLAGGMEMVYFDGATGPWAPYLNNRYFLAEPPDPNAHPTGTVLHNLDGTAIDTSGWPAVGATAGGTLHHILMITSPYTAVDLPSLKFTQSFDTLSLFCPGYDEQEMIRHSETSWTITRVLPFPKVAPSVNNLAGAAGGAGAADYLYKVTTVDLSTKEESFPGMIGGNSAVSQVAIDLVQGISGASTVRFKSVTAHGLAVNDHFTVTANYIGVFYTLFPPPPHWFVGQVIKTNTTYVVTAVVNAFEFDIVDPNGSIYPINIPLIPDVTPAYISKPTTTASTTITAINQANPMKITTQAAHQLVDGQEVLIQNCGVFGLDNCIFNITKVDATNVTLNGVDGSDYAAYGGTGGVMGPTELKISTAAAPTEQAPAHITWGDSGVNTPANIGNRAYVVYKAVGGVWGAIGLTAAQEFYDTGIIPGVQTPPTYLPIFIGEKNQPKAGCYYDQRKMVFATDNHPQGIRASVIGKPNNYSIHNPIIDSDAIVADISSNELARVVEAVDVGTVVVLTDLGPFLVNGEGARLTPTNIAARKKAFIGCALFPRPLVADKSIVHVLTDGRTVQELQIQSNQWGTLISGTKDLSILAGHMTLGYQIMDWDYQQFPHSIFWSTRNDGALLSLTYNADNGVLGWAIHRSLASDFENVCVAQEGQDTVLYAIINRPWGRTVECLENHFQTDVRDYFFVDAGVKWDGRLWLSAYPGTSFVAATNGGDWSVDDDSLTLTATNPVFLDEYVGGKLQFTLADGRLDFDIVSKTSTTVIAIRPSRNIPAAAQGSPLSNPVLALATMSGLWHLEGQTLSVLADGEEEANATADGVINGLTPKVVVNGQITLSEPYGVIVAGLPIIADLRTLNPDNPQAETTIDKKKITNKVNVGVYKTRGLWLGQEPPDDDAPAIGKGSGLVELKMRKDEGYMDPVGLATGFVQEIVQGRWTFSEAGAFIRQTSPLPATITTISPSYEE